jgi:hypothetical protein
VVTMPNNDPMQVAIDALKADLFYLCQYGDEILAAGPSVKKSLLKRFQAYADTFFEAACQAIRHGERCSFYEACFFAFKDGEFNFHCLPTDFLLEALRPTGEFTGETWSEKNAASR